MSMTFILIQSRFDIDINNDLLENIWEHKIEKSRSSFVMYNNMKPK